MKNFSYSQIAQIPRHCVDCSQCFKEFVPNGDQTDRPLSALQLWSTVIRLLIRSFMPASESEGGVLFAANKFIVLL